MRLNDSTMSKRWLPSKIGSVRRHEMALICGAVRDGGNVAAEQHAPYAQEPAARLGRVAVLGDFNRPVAFADRDVGQRQRIAGGQLGLCVRGTARQPKECERHDGSGARDGVSNGEPIESHGPVLLHRWGKAARPARHAGLARQGSAPTMYDNIGGGSIALLPTASRPSGLAIPAWQ